MPIIPSTPLFCPFHFHIDPMERLLLINFEKDPDSIYIGFEPQYFDDEVNGKGLIVIAWRIDGKIEVYHQPGLSLDPGKYDIAGKGLAHMVECRMEHALFEVNAQGVQAHIQFKDMADREVLIQINERNPKQRKPFGLLAPMGQAAESPSAMPMVLLHDFYFVRKRHTEISVKIDGKSHTLDELPVPMDFTKMYFCRYSPDPFIVTFNTAFEGELTPLQIGAGGTASLGDMHYELEEGATGAEIKALSGKGKRHAIRMELSPALPDILQLPSGAQFKGSFRICGHPSTGSVSGHYEVEKKGSDTRIELIPSGGWKPVIPKLSIFFMFTVAKIFKHWPKTYRWTAVLREVGKERLSMTSSWERIGSASGLWG